MPDHLINRIGELAGIGEDRDLNQIIDNEMKALTKYQKALMEKYKGGILSTGLICTIELGNTYRTIPSNTADAIAQRCEQISYDGVNGKYRLP